MKKNEQLVKHHFWILFGVAPVLVGLAFLLMWIFVSGAVTTQRDAYAKSLKDLGLEAKTAGQVKAKETQKEVLTKQKDELWSANYVRQDAARVFDWPTGSNKVLQAHSDKKYKFGDAFRVQGTELTPLELQAAFDKGYDRLSEDLAPTRFAGGHWKTALRYVSNWGRMPLEPPVLWLALEDFWAQKALLLPIAELNDAAAKFADVTPKEGANNPLKRRFRNRVWELDLEVYEDGRKKMMRGELRNVTDRLQVIGMGKSMRVNVWLDDAKNSQPDFAFLIQGENVAGRGKLTCTPREITSTGAVNGIVRVEQVFDAATAPVRLVNTIELGMLDHKNRAAVLEVPKHLESAEGDTTTAPAAALPGEGGPGSPDGMTMPGGPPGGMMGMMGASGGSGKSGSPAVVLLGNKKRYLKRTEDVRRMPVALSLVMDRDFVNDLLISYANSVLRFQVTQTQWQRYRDTLPPIGGSAPVGVGGPGGGIPGMGGPSAGGPGGTGSADGGDGERGGYGSSMMMQRGGPGGKGGGPAGPPGGGDPGMTGTLSASEDDMVPPEANAGLVELAVFGVISLYEKKLAPPPGAAPAAGEQPANPMGENPTGEKAPADDKQPTGDKPMPMGDKAAPAPTPPTGEKAPAPTSPTGEKEKAPAPGEKAPPAGDKPMTPAGSPTQPMK